MHSSRLLHTQIHKKQGYSASLRESQLYRQIHKSTHPDLCKQTQLYGYRHAVTDDDTERNPRVQGHRCTTTQPHSRTQIQMPNYMPSFKVMERHR